MASEVRVNQIQNQSGLGTITVHSSGSVIYGNAGIQTSSISGLDLVGAANSFRGLYIGDGSLLFNSTLNNPGGYYITTGANALNAGPVTLDTQMTLDGTWVIV